MIKWKDIKAIFFGKIPLEEKIGKKELSKFVKIKR